MLYNEFLKGTGCRDTSHNYDVYKRVESLYMFDEAMTKEEAYAIGGLWIDNSLTPAEIEFNARMDEEIACSEWHIKELKADAENYNEQAEYSTPAWRAYYKELAKGCRAEIKREREHIRECKSCKVSPDNWNTVQILTAR